jgi:hypothetical protein
MKSGFMISTSPEPGCSWLAWPPSKMICIYNQVIPWSNL